MPNKVTRTLRDALMQSFEEVGGAEYLVIQARTNPTAYLSMLAKIIPTEVTGAGGGGIKLIVQTGVPRDDD